MAIIISYSTSASGVIFSFKTPTKCREFFPTLFVKTTFLKLVFNFEQTHTVTHQRIALFNDSVLIKPVIHSLEIESSNLKETIF